jgi:hypothetical protein
MNLNRYFLIVTIAIIGWPSAYGQTWNTTGNSGTTMSNFLGTTDSKSLRFRTNNTQVAILDSIGKFGIGIAIPSYNLDETGLYSPVFLNKVNIIINIHCMMT